MKPIRKIINKDILTEIENNSKCKLERLLAQYLKLKINKLNK